MKVTNDLSSAYAEQDETLSWPALCLVIVYSLTIGWIRVLARCILLYGTSPQTVAAYGSARDEPWLGSTMTR